MMSAPPNQGSLRDLPGMTGTSKYREYLTSAMEQSAEQSSSPSLIASGSVNISQNPANAPLLNSSSVPSSPTSDILFPGALSASPSLPAVQNHRPAEMEEVKSLKSSVEALTQQFLELKVRKNICAFYPPLLISLCTLLLRVSLCSIHQSSASSSLILYLILFGLLSQLLSVSSLSQLSLSLLSLSLPVSLSLCSVSPVF